MDERYEELPLDTIRWMLQEAGITLLPDMTAPCSILIYGDTTRAITARGIRLRPDELTPAALKKRFKAASVTRIALYQFLREKPATDNTIIVDPTTYESRYPEIEEIDRINKSKGYILRAYLSETLD